MKRWHWIVTVLLVGAMFALGCGGSSSDDDRDNNPLGPDDKEGGNETTGYTVSGRILATDSHPIDGVEVGLINESVQKLDATDSDGYFSITGVSNGYYVLTPLKSGYTFNPEYRVVTVNGANIANQTFTGTQSGNDGGGGGDISEEIRVTIGEGLTPQISWTGGNINALIVMDTSAWGSNYQWRIDSPEGQVNAISSPVTYGVAPNGIVEDVNKPLEPDHEYRVTISRWSADSNIIGYGYFSTEGLESSGDGYQVSGAVVDNSRHGIAGAVVILASETSQGFVRTAITDTGGVYTFPDIPDGDYTITVTHPSYTFDPAIQEITVAGKNKAVSNFVAE